MSMNRPVPAPRHYGSMGGHSNESVAMTTTTTSPPSHSGGSSHGNHPGHCRKESWGNAATFASHGISPVSHHNSRMSPNKHENNPTLVNSQHHSVEMSTHLKSSIAHSLAAVHNSHMAQKAMGHDRSMSTGHVNEGCGGGNMKSSKSSLISSQGGLHGLQSRSSGSLDNHGSAGNRGGNLGESCNRGNRGHRGSNASLGAGPGSGSIDISSRKISQERLNFCKL